MVNLTGDYKLDTAAWKRKITDEVLSTTAHSQQWAANLSRYLRMKINSSEPDLFNLTSFQEQRDRHPTYKSVQDQDEAQMCNLQKIGSTRLVSGNSAAIAISATSRMSGLSHGTSKAYHPDVSPGASGSVELISFQGFYPHKYV